ncbi:transposase, partial [Ammonifex thiophilus]
MAHYQVTVDGEVLQQLFSRDDGLARLVEQELKAKPYERTEERQAYRNGHREKPLVTRIG